MNRYKRRDVQKKNAAREEVSRFFSQAVKAFGRSKKEANRNVRKARRAAMKARVRVPREYQRSFCKHCYSFLKPGVNVRVRTQPGKVVYYCLECKKFMRYVR